MIHTAFVLHLPDSSTACEQVVVAYSHPELWGFMIHFDLRIFLKWVGEKPPTISLAVGTLTPISGSSFERLGSVGHQPQQENTVISLK